MNVTRKQAFEALLTFEMDFEGQHFTELSEGAQDLIRSLLQVNLRTAMSARLCEDIPAHVCLASVNIQFLADHANTMLNLPGIPGGGF